MSTTSFTGKRKLIEHRGREITVYDLAAEHGLEPWAVYQRWRRGDRGELLTRLRSHTGGWQRRRAELGCAP